MQKLVEAEKLAEEAGESVEPAVDAEVWRPEILRQRQRWIEARTRPAGPGN